MSDDPLDAMERSIHPYRERFETHDRIPAEGRPREEVLAELEAMAGEERAKWLQGYASGAVYAGEPDHVEFLNRAYSLHSQSNPLHLDLWPSAAKSEAARERGIGFHTDACLGGFVLPWAEKLGADVPPFDFRLPGVTSMSCDTHKFGYAAKGTSVVLYRGESLRHHQFFTFTD